MTDLFFKTRREFLRDTVIGGAMTWTVPAFIQATMQSPSPRLPMPPPPR